MMDINQESYLLRLYLYQYIDRLKPVTLDYQTRIHSQKGYIDEGHNGKDFPDFKTWKRIREMFPVNPIKEAAELFNIGCQYLNEIKPEDLILIPRRDLPIDIISRIIIQQYAKNIDKSMMTIGEQSKTD